MQKRALRCFLPPPLSWAIDQINAQGSPALHFFDVQDVEIRGSSGGGGEREASW